MGNLLSQENGYIGKIMIAHLGQELMIDLIIGPAKAYKDNRGHGGLPVQKLSRFLEGNPAGPLQRKTVGAGAYCREGNTRQQPVRRQLQRIPVAAGQQFVFPGRAAAPYRADGMDDKSARQPVTSRDSRLAGRTSADGTALGQQFRPGGPVSGTVDATAAQERTVSGIDNGINLYSGYIVHNETERSVRHRNGPGVYKLIWQ